MHACIYTCIDTLDVSRYHLLLQSLDHKVLPVLTPFSVTRALIPPLSPSHAWNPIRPLSGKGERLKRSCGILLLLLPFSFSFLIHPKQKEPLSELASLLLLPVVILPDVPLRLAPQLSAVPEALPVGSPLFLLPLCISY